MKKKILFLLTVFLTLVLSFSITACSSNDEDNPSLAFDSNTIIGEWTVTEVSGISEWYWIKEGKTLTFKNDGSCITGFSMENAYRIKNGRVETYYKDTVLISKKKELRKINCRHFVFLYVFSLMGASRPLAPRCFQV